jgi:hypothetical protein
MLDGPGRNLWLSDAGTRNLREELRTFQNETEALIEGTADAIARRSPGNDVRNASLLWKTRLSGRLEDKLKDPNPMVALLDAWVFAKQVLEYMELGEGKDLFKSAQPQAVEAARRTLERVREIAERYMPPDKLPATREQIARHAADHKLTGLFEETRSASVRSNDAVLGGLQQVLALPLAPFRAAEGVREGAGAFTKFNETVADLPRKSRWEAEVFLTTLDRNETVQSALASVDRTSRSAERFAAVAENLPRTVQETVDGAVRSGFKAVDENRTTQAALGSLQQIGRSTERFAQVAEKLPETGRQLVEQTVKPALAAVDQNASVRSALDSFERISRSTENLPERIGKTVDGSVQQAAEQIRKTLDGSMKAAAEQIGQTLDGSMKTAAQLSAPVIDHVAVRTAQLIGLVLVGVAVLIVLSRLLPRRASSRRS